MQVFTGIVSVYCIPNRYLCEVPPTPPNAKPHKIVLIVCVSFVSASFALVCADERLLVPLWFLKY